MATDIVSVIVVTCNSLPSLDGCLAGLLRAVAAIDHELLVVDNNSTEDPSPLVRSHFPDARVQVLKKNVGFATACNRGARAAKGMFLLFLNPDVVLDSGAVSSLLAALKSYHKPGAVAGRMRYPDGGFQPTCRRLPTIGNIVFSRGSVLSRLFGRNTLYTLPDYEETTPVPAVAATVMLIRRSLFMLMKGFDQRFLMYMEDTDLCKRLSTLGYVNLFVPTAGAVHDWGRGSDAGRTRRSWLHHNSMWKYFLKHLPNGFSLLVLPLILTVNFLFTLVIGTLQRSGRK